MYDDEQRLKHEQIFCFIYVSVFFVSAISHGSPKNLGAIRKYGFKSSSFIFSQAALCLCQYVTRFMPSFPRADRFQCRYRRRPDAPVSVPTITGCARLV